MSTSSPPIASRTTSLSIGDRAAAARRRRRGGPAIAIRIAAGSTAAGWPARARAPRGRQARGLERRRLGDDRVPRGAGDAAPVRVAAVDRGLDERARHDGPGDRAGVGIVGRAGDLAGDERRGALAVGGLLAGEVAGDGLDRRGERGARAVVGGRRRRARRARRRGRTRCRWWTCRRRPTAGSTSRPPRRRAARGASRGRRSRR